MLLEPAYQNFIDIINGNNRLKGIHNNYVFQLTQEVDIQDDISDEIININKRVYEVWNEEIFITSMRNVFN